MSIDGVLLTVLAVLVGLVVGFVRRGRLERIAGHPVRAKTLLVVGVVVPALADRFTREVAVPLVVVALAALFAFALCNVRLVGMSVMAIGILGNLLATFFNHGMPVRPAALVAAGLATSDEVDRVELSGARRLEEPTHQLRFLGDIIPLEETGQVLSFGDLVILVGLADITANLTLRRRTRRDRPVEDDDVGRDALDEIARVLHARRGRTTTAGGPRPVPRAAVVAGDDGPVVVLDAPDRSPDVEWFAPYPPRGTFWLDALPDAPAPALDLDLPALDLPALDLAPPPPPPLDASGSDPASPVTRELTQNDDGATIDETTVEPELPVEPEAAIDEPAVDEPAVEPEPAVEAEAAVDEPAVEAEAAVEEPADEGAVLDLVGEVPVLDLVGVAEPAVDDDPLAALFRDLTPKKRGKRRGARNIPDFEPVHIDDVITPSGR